MIRVLWEGSQPMEQPGFLTFDGCQFQLADDVESTDTVRIAETIGEGGTLLFTNSTHGCECEWFDPNSCSGCSAE
jgi:hypothetical protein